MGWLGKIGDALGFGTQGVDAAKQAAAQYNGIRPLQQSWQNVSGSQYGQDALRSSIGGLMDMSKTGYSDSDRARQEQLLQETNRQASSVRGAALNDLARKGNLNGGGAVSAALLGSQQASNNAAEQERAIRAEGEARKLQVLNQLGVQGQNLDNSVFQQNSYNQEGRMSTQDQNYQRMLELQQLRSNALLGVGNAYESRNNRMGGLIGAGLGAAGKAFGK